MRARIGPPPLVAIFALLMSAAAAADDELSVPPEQQTGLALTVYQQDLALVQDRRMVNLTEGLNRIAFAAVSAQLRPETVWAEGVGGDPLQLVEQRYDHDLLTARALLDASVGHEIRIAIRNPQTGDERVEKATVLAAAEGVVLKIGDRIETTPPGRLIYASVPSNLRQRPTLVLALTSLRAGETPVELSYLTGGLSWAANYVAELDTGEDKLALIGRASVSNATGANFAKAHLTLVAGTLNRVSEPGALQRAEPRMGMAMAMDSGARVPVPPAPESLADYYRFAFDREIRLGDRETIQLPLLEAAAVPVEKQYWLAEPALLGAASDESFPLRIDIRLSFKNDKAAGLGMPLPGGVVRVYQRAGDGALAFLGEDTMAGTPADKPVKLTLGQAFDVTAERRQTSFAHPAEKSTEAGEEVTLHNAKDKPVTVTVVETIPGDWRILDESDPHEKATGSSARWRIEVPAKGTRKLTYHVQTRF